MKLKKLLAALFLVPAIASVLFVLPAMQVQADSDNGQGQWTDKCITKETEDHDPVSIRCGAKGPDQEHGDQFSGDAKKECREDGSKCSSSQTENGDLNGNRFKKGCFDGTLPTC